MTMTTKQAQTMMRYNGIQMFFAMQGYQTTLTTSTDSLSKQSFELTIFADDKESIETAYEQAMPALTDGDAITKRKYDKHRIFYTIEIATTVKLDK